MIFLKELQSLCADRLEDAKILFNAGRYDSAFYLCGYVVEITLKRKICDTLKWEGYPSTKKEFENIASFKTHNLEVLLRLSGIEPEVMKNFFPEWSIVITWFPEVRYSSQNRTEDTVKNMITAAETLLKNL